MLDQRLKTTGWQIAQTVVLGLLAACLSLFGQVCLERARPIFPALDQNFAAWQSAYTLVLIVIGIVWLVAMLQRISFFQDCLERLRSQRRLDERYAVRRQQAEEARQAKQAEKAAREAEAEAVRAARLKKNMRSTKFDY
jgi:C4-dicarboxylate-specific signal transduction histidine kinase